MSTAATPDPAAPSAPPAAAPLLQGIGQVAIVAQDVPRATRFYRDVLGLPLLFEAPPGLAFFACGGVRLMLGGPEGDGTPAGTSILYYEVADIHAAHATLSARGAVFEQPPHVVATLDTRDLWMAFLRDSEGNLLAVMSEVEREGQRAVTDEPRTAN